MRTLIQHYGLLFVALNVFLEQLGAPIPAAPALAVAGALARDGEVPAGLLVLVAVLGAVAADSIWFAVGRRFGSRALRFVCQVSLSPDACVRQTESLFTRLGARALLLAKFVPGLSAVSTPLAGASGMPVGKFLLFDAAGAFFWAGSVIVVGALLHRQIDQTLDALASLRGGAAWVVLGALALYVFWRLWERRRFMRVFAMTRIAPDELAARLVGENPPQVFDVRSEAARLRDPRAIPGSRPLGLHPQDVDLAAFSVELDVVLYCT